DFGYPRFTWDHLPSVDEVLSINMDDCDGIAVVTCSLLERLNINYDWNISPFIAESDSHSWTIVFNETGTVPILGTEVARLNWWTSAGNPYYMFNRHGHIYFPQGIFISALTIFLDGSSYEDYYINILNGEEFGPLIGFLAWPLLFLLLFFLAFLITLYLNIPKRFKPKKQDLLNVVFGGTTLSISALILYFVGSFGGLAFGNLIILVAFIVTIFCMDQDYMRKLIDRYKKN
ncbi:MAG: hypothetical protein ACTSRW_01225, partial [Candidatus Helarchaeota archaeon]